jgi:hypothetical protein
MTLFTVRFKCENRVQDLVFAASQSTLAATKCGANALVRADNTSAAVRWRLRAYLFLGEKGKALDELDSLERLADGWLFQLEDPIYDPVRHEPRFKALLKRLRYPESMWAR